MKMDRFMKKIRPQAKILPARNFSQIILRRNNGTVLEKIDDFLSNNVGPKI